MSSFGTIDESLLERLKLAAAEIAFLTERGYDKDEVSVFVAKKRALGESDLALLAASSCSETVYRGRAAKEMLPEDIAKRPLLVDGHGILDAVTTALGGGTLLEALDQTVRPLVPGGVPEKIDEAFVRIGAVLKEMRPSKTKWVLSSGRAESAGLGPKLEAAAKKWRVPVEVVLCEDPHARLRGVANVATCDAALIDASKSWCNLAGPVVRTIEQARKIRLQ